MKNKLKKKRNIAANQLNGGCKKKRKKPKQEKSWTNFNYLSSSHFTYITRLCNFSVDLVIRRRNFLVGFLILDGFEEQFSYFYRTYGSCTWVSKAWYSWKLHKRINLLEYLMYREAISRLMFTLIRRWGIRLTFINVSITENLSTFGRRWSSSWREMPIDIHCITQQIRRELVLNSL